MDSVVLPAKTHLLQSFVVLAEELHVTDAASRLGMRQQALSGQISHLERILGVDLFSRTTRQVVLTPAGQELYKHADRILMRVDAILADARRTTDGEHDVTRISYTPGAGQEALDIAEAARALNPSMRVSLVEYWVPESLDGVRSGRFDGALLPYLTYLDEDGLEAMAITHERLGVIVTVRSRLSRQRSIAPSDLSGMTMALFQRSVSPILFDQMVELFTSDAQIAVYEYENVMREFLLGDFIARREVAGGRWFTIHSERAAANLPVDFIWLPVEPERHLAYTLVHRADSSSERVARLTAWAAELIRRRSVASASN